ncbi:cytosine permease [uncultured Novosphingobium sp.]|uniref:purine-cytosine permease family protein n=1 Tax=uncultured Novosphingobium sp. TaxID=292277 RepID=UPI0025908379|nr:cytosine permease [uncultured Novosphingobium sp.]
MKLLRKLAGLVERNPERPPEAGELRRWPFLTLVLVGVSISVPFFAFGGQLGQRADFTTVAIGVILGSALLGIWGVITGYIGLVARLPTAMIIQRTFGRNGSMAIVAMMVLTSFCWFGLQTQILVKSLSAILRTQLNYQLDERLGVVLVGALIASTAVIGVKAMGKVAVVSVPLLLLATLVPLAIGLDRHGAEALFAARVIDAPMGLGMIVSVVVGAEVFGCSINPDLSRFLKTAGDNATAMTINYAVAFPLLLILAAALGTLYGNADLVATMLAAGIALPGTLIIILATWTSNDKNLYASALALSALFPKVERWQLATVAGVLGTCLAAADILGHFILLLTFMGLLIAPMSGAYVADFLMNRTRYTDANAAIPAYRAAPIAAWIFGIVIGIMTLPRENVGLGLFELTHAPTVDALLAAMAFLFVAQRVTSARPATA